MTGSSTTSSAWMLLLTLLGLFIFPSHVHMLYLPREISVDLGALKTCLNGSNKPHFNIPGPQLECPFPYFITGIKSLNCSNTLVNNLIIHLESFNHTCPIQNNNCILNVSKPLITPQEFQEKLENLIQNNNAKGCFTS